MTAISGITRRRVLDGTERVDGRLCDVVHAWVSPGLGYSAMDRVSFGRGRTGASRLSANTEHHRERA